MAKKKVWVSVGIKNGVEKFQNQNNKKEVKFYTYFRDPNSKATKIVNRRIKDVTNQREAEEYVRELKKAMQKNLALSKKAPVFDDVFPAYLNKEVSPLSAKTKRTTKIIYDKHIKPYIGSKRLDQITVQDVESLVVKALKTTKNITAIRTIINGTYKASKTRIPAPTKIELVSWSDGKVNNTTKLSKLTTKSFKEIARCMFHNILEIKNKNKRLILLLSLTTARRIGEIVTLTENNFNLKQKSVTVLSNTTKSKVTETYPIPDEVVTLLKDPDSFVRDCQFGKHKKPDGTIAVYNYQTYANLFKELLIKCTGTNQDLLKGKATHQSRHLYVATMAKEQGFDLQIADAMLSHKQSEIILERYGIHLQYQDYSEYFNHYWSLLRD